MSNSTTKEDGLVHFWFGYFMDGMGGPSNANHGLGVQLLGGSMARNNNGVHSVKQMALNIEK